MNSIENTWQRSKEQRHTKTIECGPCFFFVERQRTNATQMCLLRTFIKPCPVEFVKSGFRLAVVCYVGSFSLHQEKSKIHQLSQRRLLFFERLTTTFTQSSTNIDLALISQWYFTLNYNHDFTLLRKYTQIRI